MCNGVVYNREQTLLLCALFLVELDLLEPVSSVSLLGKTSPFKKKDNEKKVAVIPNIPFRTADISFGSSNAYSITVFPSSSLTLFCAPLLIKMAAMSNLLQATA